MTVGSNQSFEEYTFDGTANQVFPVPFKFIRKTDIQVDTVNAGVVESPRPILDVNYTLTGAGNENGGTLTWIGTKTSGIKLQMQRFVPVLQDFLDTSEVGSFSATGIEEAADFLVMMIQQFAERIGGPDYFAERFLGRAADLFTSWDALSYRIRNVADPTSDQDAATKAFVASQISGAGNVPAPLVGDTGKQLTATGAGTFNWQDKALPTSTADDVGRIAVVTGANTWALNEPNLANLIINGSMELAQRGTSFTAASRFPNNDGQYTLDRWALLSDGDDRVDVSQDMSIKPTGATSSMKLEVETVTSGAGNAERFGIVQVLENRDVSRLQDKVVSLRFQARTSGSARIENIRVGIISWTGTADASGVDCVSAWNAEGVNPTLAANFTYENTPANIAVTQDSFGEHTIENISIDTPGMTNVLLFFWCDDRDHVAGDVLYIGDVQLTEGPIAPPFRAVPIATEIVKAQRFFNKSYNLTVAPGTVTDAGALVGRMNTTSSTRLPFLAQFKTTMRTTPTMQVISNNTGTVDRVYKSGTGDIAATPNFIGTSGGGFVLDVADGTGANYQCHYTADAEL